MRTNLHRSHRKILEPLPGRRPVVARNLPFEDRRHARTWCIDFFDRSGPTVLDLRQSMVRWLAQFASYCETRNGAEVASTGLACLLVLALKSPAPEDW